jgi:coenzyme F420-0:L-glutamate ligase/coenzyme F420-1:gamma-L-glutamate ligase
VCANAGVDQSNTGDEGVVVLLPEDPDRSARTLRAALRVGAVVITDSWGRPWRTGQVEVAIGSAGLRVAIDHRGWPDRDGRPMTASVIAVADEAAAAADLVRKKTSGEPAVRMQGLANILAEGDDPGAAALVRPPDEDLFR